MMDLERKEALRKLAESIGVGQVARIEQSQKIELFPGWPSDPPLVVQLVYGKTLPGSDPTPEYSAREDEVRMDHAREFAKEYGLGFLPPGRPGGDFQFYRPRDVQDAARNGIDWVPDREIGPDVADNATAPKLDEKSYLAALAALPSPYTERRPDIIRRVGCKTVEDQKVVLDFVVSDLGPGQKYWKLQGIEPTS